MKKKADGIIYYIIFFMTLLLFSTYVLLDTFVIPHAISKVQSEAEGLDEDGNNQHAQGFEDGLDDMGVSEAADMSDTSEATGESDTAKTDGIETSKTVYTDNSYQDENISININSMVVNDTTVYIADVVLGNAEYLKTSLAMDTFGTNVTEKTSLQAEEKGAILAVNGDFYGAKRKGYVIKNGTIYRDSVRDDTEYDDLVIYDDGGFEIINEENISAQQLVENGVVELFAFGPALVESGKVVVDEDTEVGKAMASNPRTAIGVVDGLHYIFVVADGRSSESEGLSVYELAQLMKSYGCDTAYNLDGGGSSTMYFNGRVINRPTTNGHSFNEREVSDIVYIGY